jgi:hypothetical protein
MTDYTKNASFTAKTGTVVNGADFDSEFDEIQTAVASKEDKANKDALSGYAGLDVSGKLATSVLPTAVARTDELSTFNFGARLTANLPFLDMRETGVAANNGNWRQYADSEGLYFAAVDDSWASASDWLAVQRTGVVIDQITLNATNVVVTGGLVAGGYSVLTTASGLNASKINAGSIPSANVPVGAVTQHQTSLSIAETQIPDGSVFARVGSNETISGSWVFSAIPTVNGQGTFPHFASSGNTGGAITVSTSAASGTPGAGDLWIQYTP